MPARKRAASKKPAPSAPKITDSILAHASRRARAATEARTATGAELFTPAQPPPGVVPASEYKGGKTLAFDQAVNTGVSWAAGASLSAMWSEGLAFPGYPYLAELSIRVEFRRLSEVLATHCTRKWIRLQSVGDEDDDGKAKAKAKRVKQLEDELKRLNVQNVFRKLIAIDGLFGRAHLYVDTGDTQKPEELVTSIGDGRDKASEEKIKRGGIAALRTVEPIFTYPTTYNSNDPLRSDWYQPDLWYVMGKKVHRTRLLTFIAREVPDILKPAYSFGGLSLSQLAKPYVDFWIKDRSSVSRLVYAFSTMVLSVDLSTSLQADGDQLFKRVELFNALRDNFGTMLVNKETEDFKNVAVPLGTLDELQAQSQEHMCAAAGYPVIILLGLSPHGLNASSEGELRAFDEWINAFQEGFVRAPLQTIVDLAMVSLWGKADPDITFAFEPLRSMDDKEMGELEKMQTDAAVARVNAGITDPLEERRVLAAKPDSPFASLDVEDVPEAEMTPMEGALGGSGSAGGGKAGGMGSGAGSFSAAADELEEAAE